MHAYPLYPKRLCLSLDGAWQFAWLGDVDLDSLKPMAVQFDDLAPVPGVWDTLERYHGRRGVGVYQCVVHAPFPDARHMRLRIGALGLRGCIWWDGQLLGEVLTAYSHAEFDLEVDGDRPHRLTIAADNRFDSVRSPLFPPFTDFYAYGGIFRSVTLTELPATRIERVTVATHNAHRGEVQLAIRISGDVPSHVHLRLGFDDHPLEAMEAQVTGGQVLLRRTVPMPRPWTLEQPALHTLSVQVGDDLIVERFGLRTIEARNSAILLNGRPIHLRGVNRHEAHPQFGPVQSVQSLIQDLQLIKELGCNFVRAVHYPHDPVMLDLCDEMGLLVWEESLAWGLDAKVLAMPEAQSQLLAQTVQMVGEAINHPSVIIWAFLNECASDSPEGQRLYTQLARAIRDADPSRLVSYASNRPDKDLCFENADVISVNLYPGWIHPQEWQALATEQVAPFLRQAAELADRQDVSGKPLLLSEIGACGLYGCRDRDHAQWSEEFQADFMAAACRAAFADPRWAGIVLWQFCDTRSFVGSGSVRTKPRGFNCAGLLDEYRRPKLAYDAVKAFFRAQGE